MKVSIKDYIVHDMDRVSVTIDSWDTYSLNHTLALIIAPSLKKFKEIQNKKGGISLTFFRKSDKTDRHGNYTDGSCKKAQERFNKVLDEMIWVFNQIANNNKDEPEFFGKNRDQYHKRIQNGLDLFAKNYGDLWW